MRIFAVVCLVLFAVYQAKANNSFNNGLKNLEDMSQKIKSEAKAIETSLGTSVANFDKVIKTGFQAGHHGVRQVYNRALKHLDNVPKECVQGVRENLLQLQADADKTFLACSNLTMAVQDLGNLVTFTGNMFLGLARSIQELTWFTNCFYWNPLKSLPCFFEWIGLIYQGTKGLISSLGNFNTELDNTLLHMLKVIEYCQARTTDEHSPVAIMTPVHQCANEPIPHAIYNVHQ